MTMSLSVKHSASYFNAKQTLRYAQMQENGREAIEMAEQLRPDLIVLDLSMPVMNGLDAARVLKRIMPTVPLIMYSAFGDRFVEQQARLIGISDVVSKSDPFSVLLAKARNLFYSTAA